MSEADLELLGGLTITNGLTVSGGTVDFSGAASGGGIELTDLSTATAAAGSSTLSYDNTTGVFTFTPPDLSSFATTSSLSSYATTASLAAVATSGAYADVTGTPSLATVATSGAYSDLTGTPTALTNTDGLTEGSTNLYFTNARATSAITGSDLDMGGNKVLFGNMYSAEGNLPSATTYHGMFAHVHGTGKGYFAHAGNWVKLLDETNSDTDVLTEGSSNLYYTDARARAAISTSNAAAGTAALAYNSSTGAFTFTPPDLSSYATSASLATVATSGAYSDLTGTPSLSGYLTDITGESLSDLSNVASTTPTDGQVLTYDTTNGWQPETPSSGGGSLAYVASQDTASATASGTDALAVGGGANARNHLYATAIGTLATIGTGSQSNIENQYSTAVGWSSLAEGNRSLALGSYAKTQGNYAISVGGSNSNAVTAKTGAYGLAAISMGYAAVAGVENGSITYPIAIGGLADATANNSTALGAAAQSTHEGSTALGYGATTSAANEVVLGGSTATQLTAGNYKFDIDQTLSASEDDYVLTYDNSTGLISLEAAGGGGGGITGITLEGNTGASSVATNAYFSMAIGSSAYADGTSSIAIGYEAEAETSRSISIGYHAGKSTSTDQTGIAIGDQAHTHGVGKAPVAIGYKAQTTGFGGVVVGSGESNSYSQAGAYGTSMGYASYANQTSCAFGKQAFASGAVSTCYGAETTASQSNSVAIGYQASSTAANKFVLGNSSINDLRCQDTGISAVSDRRDKTQIEALTIGLDFVNAIEPKAYYKNNRNDYYEAAYTIDELDGDDTLVQSYTFNQSNYDAATAKFTKREFGFVAQDVAGQLPEQYSDARVSFAETDDIHGFDVQRFTPADMLPIAWKALRELSDKHDQLQSDYDALLARVVALENA